MKKKILKIALVCLPVAITITAFILMNFTQLGVAKLNKLNGGKGMFDTMFGYTAAEAYAILSVMRTAGVKQHLIIHLIDYVFIMGYFICMILAALPFLKGKYQLLSVLVPTALVFADLIENITMDVALLKFPQRMDALYNASNVFSWIKWALLAAWVIFFVAIVVIWFLEKRKTKAAAEQK